MPTKITMALAAAIVIAFVSPVFADSVDGKHTYRTDQRDPDTERGTPVILFEGRGAMASPGDPSWGHVCMLGEEYDRYIACGAQP